jgi:hypothetical protein
MPLILIILMSSFSCYSYQKEERTNLRIFLQNVFLCFLIIKSLSLFYGFTFSPNILSYLALILLYMPSLQTALLSASASPSSGEVKNCGAIPPLSHHEYSCRGRNIIQINIVSRNATVPILLFLPAMAQIDYHNSMYKKHQSCVNTFIWGANKHCFQVTQTWNCILMHISGGRGYRTDQAAAWEITGRNSLFAVECR